MLLPQELRNYTFSHAIRGYTVAEVEEYIEFLVGKYEELYRENGELEHKLSIAMQSLDTLRAREAKIAALDAEVKKTAARMLADSEKKQQEILADAETRRRQIIDDAGEYADRIVAEADAHVSAQENRFAALQKKVEALRDTLFAAYSEHIDQVEALVSDVLAENFTDPAEPAADLAEIAEEVTVLPAQEEIEEAPTEESNQQVEEIEEYPEDVYTEEELLEEDPEEEEDAPAANAAIFLPDDFHYDEDVYSDEELAEKDDLFAEPEVYEDPETFAEPASFAEPEIVEDTEYFEDLPEEKTAEEFEELVEKAVLSQLFADEGTDLAEEEEENDPLAEEDARLLQELHDAFDQSFAALTHDTVTEEASLREDDAAADEKPAGEGNDDGDEWLAALKKLENVISSPSKYAPPTDPDAFTFIEEPDDAVDLSRHGLFGKKKPKNR